MITLQELHARAAERGKSRFVVKNVSLTWERGVLAVLGIPADGTTALLEVIAGVTRARAGRVLVDGVAPSEARRRIAYVPLEPMLPDALDVEEVCDLAAEIRREPKETVASRLAPLGIEVLARRRVRSLSPGETRAVALAVALSSRAGVLLIEEPLAGLEPPSLARVIEVLRARAKAGAAIVVTTSSVRDATRLADQLGILTQGVFAHLPASRAHLAQIAHLAPPCAKLRVIVAAKSASEVAAFVAALGEDAAIASVETASFAAARASRAAVVIVASGADLLGVARAVGAAAARTSANVEAIESEVVPRGAIHASVASSGVEAWSPSLGPAGDVP